MIIPPMCEVKTFPEIVAELVSTYQLIVPGYIQNESDEVMPVLEAFAYRELLLRTHFNAQITGSFWQTATGTDLEFIAAFFDIHRLSGAKPTGTVTFTLNTALSYDYVLESWLEMVNSDGSISILMGDVTITAGLTTGTGTAELQIFVSSSDATVSATMVPKPYLESVVLTTPFIGGSNAETDEAMRERIALSFEAQTTAGSANSYKLHAIESDSRIDDVYVYSVTPGEVEVIVHSLSGVDLTMLNRVELATSGETVRPLTDTVNVRSATVVNYSVTAALSISIESDTAVTLAAAQARLAERLADVKIGKNVTLGMIIAALSVDGVEDVTLAAPIATVSVLEDQVAVVTTMGVSVV